MTAVRALIAIGLAAFWFAMFAPPMFMAPPIAITGVRPAAQQLHEESLFPRNRVLVAPGSPAYRAGLRSGDILQCLSVRDYNILLTNNLQGYTPGSPISVCVQRNGVWKNISFVAQAGRPIPNAYGSNMLAAIRVCVVLVFFVTGIALVTMRPGLSTWLFYAYAIGSAPSWAASTVLSALPAWQYAVPVVLTNFGTSVDAAFILLFAVVVPDDRVPHGWRRRVFLAACGIAALDIAFSAFSSVQTFTGISFIAGYLLDQVVTILTIVVIVVRLISMQRTERARFGWAAFGLLIGVIANDLRNVLPTTSFQGVSTFAGDLTVVMPVCLLYAILKRHVIDVRFAMSRTVVYAIITTFVIAVIGAVDWATSAYLHEARIAMALDAAVTIGIAFALNRVHRRVESTVDFLLFHKKYQAETFLARLGRTLLSASQEETIDRALVRDPYERLELTMAALYRNTGTRFVLSAASSHEAAGNAAGFEYDHDVVRFLNTERVRLPLSDLTHNAFGQSATAVPIFQGRDLMGFAVYGIHRGGTNLDPDELETLEHLCQAAAQAYTYIEVSRYRAERAQPFGRPALS